MDKNSALQPGQYYHVFHRGNNRQDLFPEERNFHYFLQLYTRYIHPIADTYAYCLMPNHFHFLIRIKDEEEYLKNNEDQNRPHRFQKPVRSLDGVRPRSNDPSQHFSNMFNTYSKAINKAYERSGSLFEERFKRIHVTSDAYFLILIFYIHYNPQKHGFVDDFRLWRWSSYPTLCGNLPTHLNRDEVFGWFGGVEQYQEYHQGLVDEKKITALILNDY